MKNLSQYICALMFLFFSGMAIASTNACEIIKQKKRPVVILLNGDGILTNDVVNLGNLKFSSGFEAEYYKIPTAYRLVAYPRSIFFDNIASGSGYVGVEPIEPICPNAAAFKVNVYMNFDKGDVRPYKFDYKFPNVMMEDAPSTPAREANEILYFKPRVIGTIVQPAK